MSEPSSPPSFGDLGGAAQGLFDNGFNYGFYGIKCSTKTQKGQEFSTEITKEHESNEVSGSLSATLINCEKHGFSVKQTWTTDNTLSTDATFEEPLHFEGFSIGLENSYKPNSKESETSIKTGYQNEMVNFEGSLDIDGMVANLASVVGFEGWLGGFQLSYDINKREMGDYTLALGYDGDDITVNATVENMTNFGSTMYRKINNETETGAFINWSKGGSATFGMAAKYVPHEDSTFGVKIDNQGEVGLSYQQLISPGVSLNLSTLIQSKNLEAGGHKVGVGIELNP